MKKQKGRFIDFNKEIMFGEIGALTGSALLSYLASLIFWSENTVSAFAVVGSILGSTTLFLLTKIHDKKKRKELSFKNVFNDLKYYTPAAATLRILFGYTLLYFSTRFIIRTGIPALYAGALGEFFSFLIFLLLINIYRLILFKVFKKRI